MTVWPAGVRVLALLLAAVLGAAAVQARELRVDPASLVPVELATVGLDRDGGAPLVLLREPDSGDVVPIRIGLAEARAIVLAQHGVPVPRPQTHDLVGNLLEALDATLERVIVDDLSDGVYYGVLELAVAGQEAPVRVDTRPSDGLALAVRAGAAILVAPAILRAGGELQFDGLPGESVVTALGITVVAATDALREALALPPREGVVVSGVRGAAGYLGLREGALILAVNGEAPETPMEFLDLVRATPDGDRARIRYLREGREDEIELSTNVPGRRGRGITL